MHSILFHPIVHTVYVFKMNAIAIIYTSPPRHHYFFCYDIDISQFATTHLICRHCIYNPLGLRTQFAIYLYYDDIL
jgi:hypothetical protein